MTVYEALMKPGKFTVPITDDMPLHIRKKITPFSSIVITPAPIAPSSQPDSSILAGALYHGTIRTRWPDIEGMGLLGWLGDEDHKGRIFAYPGSSSGGIATTTQNLSAWVTAILAPPLTPGTVAAAGNHTGTYTFMSRRQALDSVMSFYGMEYRVRPNMTVDVNYATVFAGTTTRIALKSMDGRYDPQAVGIVADGGMTEGWEDFTNRVWVRTRGGVGGAGTPVGWVLPSGGSVQIDRIIDMPEGTPGSEATLATLQLARFNSTDGRRFLPLRSRAQNIRSLIEPGHSVRLWDPTTGLEGTDTTFSSILGFNHRDILLRCYGIRWPIREGMGVYIRRYLGVAGVEYIDISPWVEWETGEAELEVGDFRKPLQEDDPASTGGNSPLRTAAMEGPWDDGPAPTGVPGTFNYVHKYRRIGTVYMARGRIEIVAGFPPTGAILFPLPSGVSHIGMNQRQVGAGHAERETLGTGGEQITAVADKNVNHIYFRRPGSPGAIMGLGGNTAAPITGGVWSGGDAVEFNITMEVNPA